jgi:hypothetical protein
MDRPSALGLATTLGAAAGALLLCLVFESLVPRLASPISGYIGDKNLNLRSIIIYVTAGGMHMLLCGGGIAFFIDQLRREQSALEFKKTIIYVLLAFAALCTAVLIASALHLNIVEHSFHGRIRPLENDPRLAFLLAPQEIKFVHLRIRPFAVLPLLLTFFGIAVAITACFWIAQKSVAFVHRSDELKPSQVAELKRSIGQLITLTTVIFTTSTIATIALMQIARDWVERGDVRGAYIQNGHAMSIFWSACYTCVTALIVIIPLWWIATRTRRIQRQAKYAGERRTFWDHIFEFVSFASVIQAGLAVLAPLLTSSFVAAFAS